LNHSLENLPGALYARWSCYLAGQWE